MIVYNVTTKVDHSIKAAWIQWMKQEHIPDMKNTGCFTDAAFFEILEIDDADGCTFTVQYFAESKGLYHQYIEKFSTGLRQKSIEKWGDKIIAFRSLMKVVQ
ncbi:MAG: DUF4286 family protein [Bacteroidetes bacterium]|nr:DUF4286 family protein [Bacteroidota bacterium]